MVKLNSALFANGSLWIIGCGNMGQAMLDRWIACGLDPLNITVIDPALPAIGQGVTVLAAPDLDMPPPGMVLLAVKPQMLDDAAAAIAPRLTKQTLLISILAGVRCAALRARFEMPVNIARAMPNLPVAIGAGVVALFGLADQPEIAAQVEAFMTPLGIVEWLDTETHFDAVTALSGSGPAFVAHFVEAMAAGGRALGLSQAQAARMALATCGGTAALLEANGEAPAAMARRVTSPNGTTQAGLAVLDEGDAFKLRILAALEAAAKRSTELSRHTEAPQHRPSHLLGSAPQALSKNR
jgi:pyrroline-5-carboxylate reductase